MCVPPLAWLADLVSRRTHVVIMRFSFLRFSAGHLVSLSRAMARTVRVWCGVRNVNCNVGPFFAHEKNKFNISQLGLVLVSSLERRPCECSFQCITNTWAVRQMLLTSTTSSPGRNNVQFSSCISRLSGGTKTFFSDLASFDERDGSRTLSGVVR